MIQNYFGEETIWKLLANNPYEKNSAQSITLMYRAVNPKIHRDIVNSILCRIPSDKLIEVELQEAPNEWKANGSYEKVVKRIVVKNVFGNESEVIIINM